MRTEVVVYDCDVSLESDLNQQFIGAAVLYYKQGSQYFDNAGNAAGMPPVNDPAFSSVFR